MFAATFLYLHQLFCICTDFFVFAPTFYKLASTFFMFAVTFLYLHRHFINLHRNFLCLQCPLRAIVQFSQESTTLALSASTVR